MADRSDRVHPHEPPPPPSSSSPPPPSSSPPPSYQGFSPSPSFPGSPPPGTYIVQVPKDHIYRYPPKDNPRAALAARPRRKQRRRCRNCIFFSLLYVLLIAAVIAAAAAAFYFVVRPKATVYSVNGIHFSGLNISPSTAARSLSPEMDLTLRAGNPNRRIDVVYGGGSTVAAFFSSTELCRGGGFPEFRQPAGNVTVLKLALKGRRVTLPASDRRVLVKRVQERNIPVTVTAEIPFRVGMGGLKLWRMTAKVSCHVSVDNLSTHSRIISKTCGDVEVKIWG